MTDDIKYYTNYGEALKAARKSCGFKQGDFAKKIGSNQSEVSRWENSDIVPLLHNQDKIHQVLNLIIAPDKDKWVINHSQDQEDSPNEPRVVHSDQVALPKGGAISRDEMKKFLEHIESLARILKDSL